MRDSPFGVIFYLCLKKPSTKKKFGNANRYLIFELDQKLNQHKGMNGWSSEDDATSCYPALTEYPL